MKKTKFRVYLVLSVLWLVIIFLQSCLSGSASRTESGALLKIIHLVIPTLTESMLRRIAHIVEFAILGDLLTGLFWNAKKFTLFKPLTVGILAALCDETIQMFSYGRVSSIKHVWLDIAGACLGTVFLWVILKLRNSK